MWHDFLYQPLFNLLIYIYNEFSGLNLGWAIVILTCLLRLVLLPFTLVNERNRVRNRELIEDIKEAEKIYSKDHIERKIQIRKIMKRRKVQPWSKVVVLGIQALVLVLLYQVFVGGLAEPTKIVSELYLSVDFPGIINSIFFGFDLGMRHSIVWGLAVAVFIWIEIYLEYRNRMTILNRGDLLYFILFPTAVFFLLYFLPMVKSLFVFTSLLFSAIVGIVVRPLFARSSLKAKVK